MNPFDNNDLSKTIERLDSKDKFSLGWSIVTVLICMIVSAGILFSLSIFTDNKDIQNNKKNIKSQVIASSKIKTKKRAFKFAPDLPFFHKRENILLLGVDSNGKHTNHFFGTRSDAIIVLSIDLLNNNVNVVSIPRDSKVFLSGKRKVDKINSAHAIGGPNLTKKTIEETFGIKINHYVVIDYKGIREFIDAVGGIPINVEKRMYYTDKTAKLYINLKQGKQVLDSYKSEQYLRFRHDAQGDIGRIKRQQYFARAVIQKIQSPDILIKIPELINICSNYIKTDMNFYELTRLASIAQKVDLNKVQLATLPGRPSSKSVASYWILDAKKTQEVINRLIYRDETNKQSKNLSVGIVYTSKYKKRIKKIKDFLESEGYRIACSAYLFEPHSKIIAHSNYANLKNAQFFRDNIPELKNAQFTVAPTTFYCGKSDYTIVLSGD